MILTRGGSGATSLRGLTRYTDQPIVWLLLCWQVWLTRPKYISSSFFCCLVSQNVQKVPFKEEKEEICRKPVYSQRKLIYFSWQIKQNQDGAEPLHLTRFEWKTVLFWYQGRWIRTLWNWQSVTGVKHLLLGIFLKISWCKLLLITSCKNCWNLNEVWVCMNAVPMHLLPLIKHGKARKLVTVFSVKSLRWGQPVSHMTTDRPKIRSRWCSTRSPPFKYPAAKFRIFPTAMY